MSRSRNAVALVGQDGPISIRRDEHGVLHVHARTALDALLGQGYCHALDRGLQLLFVRILARGELSRYLDASEKALAIDTWFRKLDLLADAAQEHERLTPFNRRAVESYCTGVNLAFAEVGTPWELRLLGYQMGDDRWTWNDIVLIAKLMGYVGLGASQGEVEHWIIECIQGGVEPALLEELFPGRLSDLDVELVRQIKTRARVIPEEIWNLAAIPKAMASNNWVVAGSKTASGKPIVCNDPHLEVNRLPAVFVETALHWGGEDSADQHYLMGGSVPGTPGIATGRNRDVAWAVTYAYMDAIDSWVEDCRDGKYRRGDEWVPFRVREETILRKGNPAVTVKFYETNEHGTLEGDPTQPGLYLATRWSNRDGTAASSVAALVGLLDASTVETGAAKLAGLSNSAWCLVLGDRQGSIGYQMSGRMPIRRAGGHGLAPLPGWDPANDWQGFATSDDLPRCFNPESGVLVTANDDLNHLGRVHPITLTLSPYRAERIRQVLAQPGPFTVSDMKALQYDLTSTQAIAFLPTLRQALSRFPNEENAQLLSAWDGVYRSDSVAATLFEQFYRTLLQELISTGLGAPGRQAAEHLMKRTTMLCEYYALFDRVLLSKDSRWFGGRSQLDVFTSAIERSGLLKADLQPWGEAQRVRVRNILLGDKLPIWLGFDRGPISLPGTRATVTQGQISSALGYPSATGPSIRLISDLATDELHSTLPGGPSDRRFSPWYYSDYENWLNGLYKTLHGFQEEA